MDNGWDSINLYFKKDNILIGIHAIGLFGLNQYKLIHLDGTSEDKITLFRSMEVWGNEYDKEMNILGRGSFRVHETDIIKIIEDYKAEGWTLLTDEQHYELNEKLGKK